MLNDMNRVIINHKCSGASEEKFETAGSGYRFCKVIIAPCVWISIFWNAECIVIRYDTTWSFVYDGGKTTTGLKSSIEDAFYSVVNNNDGTSICAGVTRDTTNYSWVFLVKLNDKECIHICRNL